MALIAQALLNSTFVRYILIGATTTLIYFVLLWAFAQLGMPLYLAAVPALGLAMVFNYTFHRAWSFRSVEPIAHSLPRYLATSVIYLVSNSGILYIGETLLDWPFWIVQPIALGYMIISNYLLFARFVFGNTAGERGG